MLDLTVNTPFVIMFRGYKVVLYRTNSFYYVFIAAGLLKIRVLIPNTHKLVCIVCIGYSELGGVVI